MTFFNAIVMWSPAGHLIQATINPSAMIPKFTLTVSLVLVQEQASLFYCDHTKRIWIIFVRGPFKDSKFYCIHPESHHSYQNIIFGYHYFRKCSFQWSRIWWQHLKDCWTIIRKGMLCIMVFWTEEFFFIILLSLEQETMFFQFGKASSIFQSLHTTQLWIGMFSELHAERMWMCTIFDASRRPDRDMRYIKTTLLWSSRRWFITTSIWNHFGWNDAWWM